MKPYLRLALPPLAQLNAESRLAFVLVDRHRRVLRSGELRPTELAALARGSQVQVILHPGEAVVATANLPPLPSRRLDAAVQARVEPMALAPLDELCIAHGAQAPDGTVQVTWTSRRELIRAWQLLHEAGLKVDAIVPHELALAEADPRPNTALALPADDRWLTPLPSWSLARQQWRPQRHAGRWGGALKWAGAALALWIAGLNLYASQLRDEARTLQAETESTVRAAFPSISAVIDPVRQARNQRDLLRTAHGLAAHDDFMPLALASAEVLGFAAGHVSQLHYGEGKLTLVLAEGHTPPADENALQQAALAASLVLEKDEQAPRTWHIRRVTASGEEKRS